jgi:hypothetical protein
MKRYKTSMILFILLPGFISILMLIYMTLIYNSSVQWVNIINITIDGIILIYCFVNFCYEIRMNDNQITFCTAFKNYNIKIQEFGFVIHSSFLTKFVLKKRNFYILTTPRSSKLLQDLFSNLKKDSK